MVRELVAEVERQTGIFGATVGFGVPGSLSPKTGRMRNANSVWLNDQPFQAGPGSACSAARCGWRTTPTASRSRRRSAARAGRAQVVFGAILGTGCGGGVVVRGHTVEGVNRIGGEWGHTPLPWPSDAEHDAHACWCGRAQLPGDLDLRHRVLPRL